MKKRLKQSGVSLTEMVIVVAIISLLVGLSLPGMRAFYNSFESQGSTRSMISAAISSARAIAAKEQRYTGIRFQTVYNRNAAEPNNPLTTSQYLIFIIHDLEGTGLANGFRAIKGVKPIKLPDAIGVMDLTVVDRIVLGNNQIRFADNLIDIDTEIDEPEELRDTTTFSIIFSPSGKLVIHEVRVRNKDGLKDSSPEQSLDDIFNTDKQITNTITPCGMFYQDDYVWMGLGPELSRNRFVIYDRIEFRQAYEGGKAFLGYLSRLIPIYINPYTGAMISKD